MDIDNYVGCDIIVDSLNRGTPWGPSTAGTPNRSINEDQTS